MFIIVCGDGQEEQHANTSANYDVELLHHKDAHLEFFKNGIWNTLFYITFISNKPSNVFELWT